MMRHLLPLRQAKKLGWRQTPLHPMNRLPIPSWAWLFVLSAVKGLSFGIAMIASTGA
jgi:hypothetical protein